MERQQIMKHWQFEEMIEAAEDSLFDDFESEKPESIQEVDEGSVSDSELSRKEKASLGNQIKCSRHLPSYKD